MLASGQCVPCPDGCKVCGADDPNTCQECISGFGVNGTACALCDDPYCTDCRGDVSVCKNCTGQGWLDANGGCQELPGNCTDADTSGACTRCFPGFAVSGGQCVPCQAGTGCVACNPANLQASNGGSVVACVGWGAGRPLPPCPTCNARAGTAPRHGRPRCCSCPVQECLTCDKEVFNTVLDEATKQCVPACKDSQCEVRRRSQRAGGQGRRQGGSAAGTHAGAWAPTNQPSPRCASLCPCPAGVPRPHVRHVHRLQHWLWPGRGQVRAVPAGLRAVQRGVVHRVLASARRRVEPGVWRVPVDGVQRCQ